MKPTRNGLKRWHTWLGLPLCLLLAMAAWSGVVLNHREAVAHLNVDRALLPDRYRFRAWNGGLLRGTLPLPADKGGGGVLVYGAAGLWRADSAGRVLGSFNRGLPSGADFRNIRHVVRTASGQLFAVGPMALFTAGADGRWREVELPLLPDERLTDVALGGDTLVVVGRSRLYVATAPYARFRPQELRLPAGGLEGPTLLRLVWRIHSGEILGLPGRLAADAVAFVLLVLSLTGLLCFVLPRYLRRRRARGREGRRSRRLLRASFLLHDRIGRQTFILTLLIAATGWCLRPPVMVPLALFRSPADAGDWTDRLRLLRYDAAAGDWLLSTSDGFFALAGLDAVPVRAEGAPPVSVMGLNVFEPDGRGGWRCGSFSGMFVWHRREARSTDYFTHASAPLSAGPPFGERAVSGFTADFTAGPVVVTYDGGTDRLRQPDGLATLPMSLWNFALEVHSGRLYMGALATLFFVFLLGMAAVGCLWTGRKLGRRERKRARRRFFRFINAERKRNFGE